MRKVNLFVGVFFIVLGIILMLHNPLGMTGYSISESGGEGKIYFAGIFLIIFGVALLVLSRRGSLERKVGEREHYDANVKSFRRHYEKENDVKIDYDTAEELYNESLARNYGTAKRERYEKAREEAKQITGQYNEAQEMLDKNQIPTRRRELIGLAIRMGYDVSEERKEGTLIKKTDGTIISVIRKDTELKKPLARGILKVLASGESSFRRRAAG